MIKNPWGIGALVMGGLALLHRVFFGAWPFEQVDHLLPEGGGKSQPFHISNEGLPPGSLGVRYWNTDRARLLTAFFSRHDMVPHITPATGQPSGTERAYSFVESGATVPAGTPRKNALQSIRDLQAGDNIVVTTMNILEGSVPLNLKGIASIKASELADKAAGQDVAILPRL